MPASIQDYVVLALDIPAFMLHISMIGFIFSRVIKKSPTFIGGFYHIFLTVALVDVVGYLYVIILGKI